RRPSPAKGLSRRDTPGDRPAALAERAGGLNRQEPVVRRGGAEPQLVPGIEGFQRIGELQLAYRPPTPHADLAVGNLDVLALRAQHVAEPAREVAGASGVAALDVGRQVHVARRLLVEL